MSLQQYLKSIRTRWITVFVTTFVAIAAAITLSLLTTPLYMASTRLFVSTNSVASGSELYQGNRFSQERVVSYTELLTGQTLAERTISKLGLDIGSEALRENVTASARTGTVLINVDVLDSSPVRARDIANALSDEFVVMVRQLETPSAGEKPDARVVVEQRATIPIKPVVPKTARNISLALIVGLGLGAGLAVLRDILDNTVKSREMLSAVTGVGVVGAIPLDKERREHPAIAFDRDNTPIAEAFRKLRTNLQFLTVDSPPRVIVVASSSPQEGKSTTAINIALSLAEAGRNVVIVDGDMRRPSVAKYLDLVASVGFSSVLSGSIAVSEALQSTKYPGLTALTAGTTPPNPSELLGSLTAKRILSDLKSEFDYVIVDSAPLLAVTDAAVLSANADGALVIARFGQTKRDQLEHAIDNLHDVGASVLGAVFTMVPTRGGSSYSYNYTYYGRDLDAPQALESPRRTQTLTDEAVDEAVIDQVPLGMESDPPAKENATRKSSD